MRARQRIALVGQRAIDFWPVVANRPVHIAMVFEGGGDAEAVTGADTVVSLEQTAAGRQLWASRNIGDLVEPARPILDALIAASRDPLTLLAYCAAPEIEQLARDHPDAIRVGAIPWALKARLDDKIRMSSVLSSHGLPVPEFIVVAHGDLDYRALATRLGSRLVVQMRTGAAGLGTAEVTSEDEFDGLSHWTSRELLVSRHVGTATLNCHGLVMNDDVEVSVPSVQLTGVPELTGNRYGYCGNDFGAVRDLPASIISTCRELVRSVGIYLAREGYVGIFGVDLAIDHAHAHILEVNPRLQGSTWLLGLLEVGSGLVPSVVKHYQVLLNGRGPVSQGGEPPAGSVAQAILHLQSNDARRVSHSLRCGVYSSGSDGALTYVRKASWPLVLSTHEVFLFGLPRTGTVVESGAVLARVACSRRLALADGRALTNGGRAIVGAIHGAFVLHSP